MIIPGFIITWLSFPGVIVHELAHAIFCRLYGLDIYAIKYFQFTTGFGQPAGYVVHGRSEKPSQDLMVSIGPFFVNTIVGAVIGAPAAIPIFTFGKGDALDWFLLWLGVSIAMHAFPSTGDAKSILHSIQSRQVSPAVKLVAYPIVGLIYLGSVASIFWVDVIYGVAVVGLLPTLIVKLLA